MRLLPYLMENTGVCEEEGEEGEEGGGGVLSRGDSRQSRLLRVRSMGRRQVLFYFILFSFALLRLSSCVRGGG